MSRDQFTCRDRVPALRSGVFGNLPATEWRWKDRARAVSFARNRSTPAFPCDVYGPDGSLDYAIEMDATPVQAGLFSQGSY